MIQQSANAKDGTDTATPAESLLAIGGGDLRSDDRHNEDGDGPLLTELSTRYIQRGKDQSRLASSTMQDAAASTDSRMEDPAGEDNGDNARVVKGNWMGSCEKLSSIPS